MFIHGAVGIADGLETIVRVVVVVTEFGMEITVVGKCIVVGRFGRAVRIDIGEIVVSLEPILMVTAEPETARGRYNSPHTS